MEDSVTQEARNYRMAVKQSMAYNKWIASNILWFAYRNVMRKVYAPKDNSLKAYCEAYNEWIHAVNGTQA